MSEKKKLSTLMIFGGGQIACFDTDDKQVGELQTSAITLWAQHAEKLGYNIEGLRVETPQGNLVMRRDPDGGWRGLLK